MTALRFMVGTRSSVSSSIPAQADKRELVPTRVEQAAQLASSGFGKLPRFLSSLLSCLILLGGVHHACAADSSSAFDAANKLYYQDKFKEAAAAYEKLLSEDGASPALHFNLGNALFKSGKLGEAIRHYRLAEKPDPRDPDIQANLHFARDTVGGGAPKESLISNWLGRLNINEWAALATISVWVWLGLISTGMVKATLKPALRSYVRWSGLVAVFVATCLTAAYRGQFGAKSAVVTATEAVVRFGPLEESDSNFTLRDGAEVNIQDTKDGWFQITDAQGRSGWVKEKQVATVE